MNGVCNSQKAYTAPFLIFLSGFVFGELAAKLGDGYAAWAWSEPRYWVYPLQTLAAGVALLWWRQHYELRLMPRTALALAVAVGVLVFVIWVAPQQWLGWVPRLEGYRPDYFGAPTVDLPLLGLRWLRLVVVVPLVEELFWRGWLMRYLVDHRFTQVPVGTFRWPAFLLTTAGFCLEHQMVDWPAAAVAGALYGWLAVRTRSLSACVLAHALTNALLGGYVMNTGQWGFW